MGICIYLGSSKNGGEEPSNTAKLSDLSKVMTARTTPSYSSYLYNVVDPRIGTRYLVFEDNITIVFRSTYHFNILVIV